MTVIRIALLNFGPRRTSFLGDRADQATESFPELKPIPISRS